MGEGVNVGVGDAPRQGQGIAANAIEQRSRRCRSLIRSSAPIKYSVMIVAVAP